MISVTTIQILQGGTGAVTGVLIVAMILAHQVAQGRGDSGKALVPIALVVTLLLTVLITALEFLSAWSGADAQDPAQALAELLTTLPFLGAAFASGLASFMLVRQPGVVASVSEPD